MASAGERRSQARSGARVDHVRVHVPLPVLTGAARVVGGLSRLTGAGGGTTLPGKLLWKLDPEAVGRLAARLPLGSALLSATNGKTTTAAMAAGILGPRHRLAHNRAGANLVSGVASTLLASDGAQLGLFEVDEAALPEVAARLRPRVLCLGNLFRDQLDRYGELELLAERWRATVDELPAAAKLVVNADDPQLGRLARARPGSVAFGLDDPRHALPGGLQHAADSKYCVVCGTPYRFHAAYVGHLGDYECPACGDKRPPLDVVARAVELEGLERARFELVTPEGSAYVRLPLPGLYNVYNALAAASLSRALGAGLEEIRGGLERFGAAFGRFERITVGDKRLLMLLIKNPAGANEAVRTLVAGGAPTLAVVALNDAVADGRDVSWIWDVDFEPLLASLRTAIVAGSRAAELALRFKYGGLQAESIELLPDLQQALDRGLELTPAGGELVVLPTYTAMLGLRKIVAGRGLVRPYWERGA
jgi:lipid II isoglutaminyl synthase (glutamine-hydrolysing)